MPPEAIVMEPKHYPNSEKRLEEDTEVRKEDEGLTAPLSYAPADRICPHCKQRVTSSLRYHITDKTHCTVFILSILTWPFGGCFLSGLPYCLKWCQTVEHLCPKCSKSLGRYSKF